MVKRTDFERLLEKIAELVKRAVVPGEAMRTLVDFAAGIFSAKFLSTIRGLPFDQDVEELEKWLSRVVATEPVPADITAYWFGLFNPCYEGAATSCLYLAGSNRFDANTDNVDWACAPKYFPNGRYANSSVLRAIYRGAEESEEPEGEYFCLWYSAIAVSTLCRRLAPVLLGASPERPVAVGFDSGDIIMLGKIMSSVFVPFDYAPPTPPIAKPTPSDALFYRIEEDPRGAWSLDHPTASNGDEDELPFGIGTWCEEIEVPTPLKVSVDEDSGGTPTAFSFAVTVPIVHLNVGNLISSLVGNDVQLVPVTIEGYSEEYRLLNILRRVRCLDLQRSDYEVTDRRTGPLADVRAGEVGYVRRAVLDPLRAGDRHLFRLDEDDDVMIASRVMKIALEEAGVTGIKFEPLETTQHS